MNELTRRAPWKDIFHFPHPKEDNHVLAQAPGKVETLLAAMVTDQVLSTEEGGVYKPCLEPTKAGH